MPRDHVFEMKRACTCIILGLSACQPSAPIPTVHRHAEEILRYQPDSSVQLYREISVRGGYVWALVSPAPYLRAWTIDGQYVKSMVEQGRGPVEMLAPAQLITRNDFSNPLVLEFGTHKVIRVDTNLSPHPHPTLDALATQVFVRYARRFYGRPGYIEYATDGDPLALVPRSLVMGLADLASSDLIRLKASGKADTLASFPGARPSGETAQYFLDVPLWAKCNDSLIAHTSAVGDSIVWLSLIDYSRSSRPWTPVRRTITVEDRRRFMELTAGEEARGSPAARAQFVARIEEMLGETKQQFATVAPRAVSMLCSSDGAALLQEFDTRYSPIGYGNVWVLIQPPPNSEQQRFAVPPGFQAHQIRGDTLVGVFQEADGIERIGLVRMPFE